MLKAWGNLSYHIGELCLGAVSQGFIFCHAAANATASIKPALLLRFNPLARNQFCATLYDHLKEATVNFNGDYPQESPDCLKSKIRPSWLASLLGCLSSPNVTSNFRQVVTELMAASVAFNYYCARQSGSMKR